MTKDDIIEFLKTHPQYDLVFREPRGSYGGYWLLINRETRTTKPVNTRSAQAASKKLRRIDTNNEYTHTYRGND